MRDVSRRQRAIQQRPVPLGWLERSSNGGEAGVVPHVHAGALLNFVRRDLCPVSVSLIVGHFPYQMLHVVWLNPTFVISARQTGSVVRTH